MPAWPTSLKLGKIAAHAGIDRAVGYNLGLRAWNALSMPVTLTLIAGQLSPAEQGFYYSFAGVQALSVVGELGVTHVIGQFAAHEYAVIRSCDNAEQAASARARLASILRLGLRWNAAVAVLCVAVLVPFGWWFFHDASPARDVEWIVPWIIFSVFSSVSIALAPLYAVLDGIGHIAETSLIRFGYTVVGGLVSWGVFLGGGKLLALVALPATAVVAGGAAVLALHGRSLAGILREARPEFVVPYWREIFPLQSRVAMSWVSGYVGFYMSTPVIFSVLSPEQAGRYGMTTNLLLSVAGIAQIWVNTKAPVLAQHAALGDVHGMRCVFRAAAIRSWAILFLGYGLVLVCPNVPLLVGWFPFFGRLLEGPLVGLLIVAFVAQFAYGLVNIFLRAFKQDPLFWVSIAVSVLNVAAVRWCGEAFGLSGVAGLFLLCNTLALTVSLFHFASRMRGSLPAGSNPRNLDDIVL